jgi:hypothetical protein
MLYDVQLVNCDNPALMMDKDADTMNLARYCGFYYKHYQCSYTELQCKIMGERLFFVLRRL